MKVLFFRLTIFFFRNKIVFLKWTTLFQFFMYGKQKKISERSEHFWKILFLKIYFIKNVWKQGFQFMLILGLLGIYFDAAVVFVTKSSLFFILAVAILWCVKCCEYIQRKVKIKCRATFLDSLLVVRADAKVFLANTNGFFGNGKVSFEEMQKIPSFFNFGGILVLK